MFTILNELKRSWKVVIRIAKYNNQQMYRRNYLGEFWQFADPLLQIGIMVLMFAVRTGADESNAQAPGIGGFIIWMALGMVTYFFMQSAMTKSAKSIQSQYKLLSKMQFDLSAIPLIEIITELRRYFTMMILIILGIIFYMGIWPSIWWLQYIYYFVAMISFLYALSLITSTITVMVPDFYNAYSAILRVGMWVSGVIITIDSPPFPETISNILKLNPLYYLIQGFRDTLLLNPVLFWEHTTLTLIFWGVTLILFIVGASLHLRFRKKFMDFV